MCLHLYPPSSGKKATAAYSVNLVSCIFFFAPFHFLFSGFATSLLCALRSHTQVMQGMPDLVLQRAEANAPRRDTAAAAVPSPCNTGTGDVAGSGGNVEVEAKVQKEGCAAPAIGGKATSSSSDADGMYQQRLIMRATAVRCCRKVQF